MAENRIERRHSEEDLELGRYHLTQMLEKLLPLTKMDAEVNKKALEITRDLGRTISAIDLKTQYERTREILAELGDNDQMNRRNEDLAEIRRLQNELIKHPIEME